MPANQTLENLRKPQHEVSSQCEPQARDSKSAQTINSNRAICKRAIYASGNRKLSTDACLSDAFRRLGLFEVDTQQRKHRRLLAAAFNRCVQRLSGITTRARSETEQAKAKENRNKQASPAGKRSSNVTHNGSFNSTAIAKEWVRNTSQQSISSPQ